MKSYFNRFASIFAAIALVLGVSGCASTNMSQSGSSYVPESGLSSDARYALSNLQNNTALAAALSKEAKAVLVFPSVVKGGFMVGGFRGDGAMFKNNQTAGYYRTFGASYGLQAGLQEYGYALYFMTDEALSYVDQTAGWEIGMGPSIVIVDEGLGKNITTTTAKSDVYAFIFDQRGLMAGLGLQGSKIKSIKAP